MARFSRIGGLVTAAVLLLLVAGPVKAAAISQIYNVTASGFGTGAPVDPVTGLFNVIFDNLSNIADTTLGISVISLGIAVDGAVGFSYSVSDDALSIGGIQGGVGGITPNTNDFSVQLSGASTTTPSLDIFLYSQVGSAVFITAQGSVTVFALTPTPTPEPSSLMLLAGGLFTTWLVQRRKTT